jgi:hypothetical protein
VTKINCDPKTCVPENGALITKISYILPKLRDFKSLALFPDSPLFKYILTPKYMKSREIFDPKTPVPPSLLVHKVSVSDYLSI